MASYASLCFQGAHVESHAPAHRLSASSQSQISTQQASSAKLMTNASVNFSFRDLKRGVHTAVGKVVNNSIGVKDFIGSVAGSFPKMSSKAQASIDKVAKSRMQDSSPKIASNATGMIQKRPGANNLKASDSTGRVPQKTQTVHDFIENLKEKIPAVKNRVQNMVNNTSLQSFLGSLAAANDKASGRHGNQSALPYSSQQISESLAGNIEAPVAASESSYRTAPNSKVAVKDILGKISTTLQENKKAAMDNSAQDGIASGSKKKALVYYASKFDAPIVDLVIDNVNLLRKSGVSVDVLIGHYDLRKNAWRQRNGSWYDKNVRWGIDAKGWKVHLLRTIHNSGMAEGLKLEDYEWVWMFDEDLDLKNTDPNRLFDDAAASGALIVGPTFIQLSATNKTETEKPFYVMNTPQPEYKFRYVPMVEVIMPLVRPCVLRYMFAASDAMAPQDHDWGMDHAWCSYSADKLHWNLTEVCAVIDHTGPIVHLNFKSTRGDSGKAKTAVIGNEAIAWVKEHHQNHFVTFPRSRYLHWEGYDGVKVVASTKH